jgi:H+-transporting ATPase
MQQDRTVEEMVEPPAASATAVHRGNGSLSPGLTQAEARRRLQQYGYNEITEKRVHPLLKLLSYFWGPIPWMIEAAAILSVLLRHWPEFSIILVLLLANALVGFWEEYQAGNAIGALKKKLALSARVLRDGTWGKIPARELVPGDITRIRLGDIVPADVRLRDGDGVEVDQSALTGESLPVTRTRGATLYAGSILRQGEAEAEVTATGAKTYFGKTAQLVEEAHSVSHFQRAVLKIGNYLIAIAALLVLGILVVALLRGDPMSTTLQFALVLTVAAIPVAMPTVLSVTMAVGAKILAAKEAIVSRLASIEELAGIDVLCSDKTGTLTQNRLTLGEVHALEGVSPEEVVLNAALASRAEDNDPIDGAVLGALKDRHQLEAYHIEHFQPFDPVGKRTEASIRDRDGGTFEVTKGAPQVILGLVKDAAGISSAVTQAVEEFARRGFRSLGVARREDGGAWKFLGVIPLFDPPREDSRETIATARQMGIRLKMLTGDQLAIARETAAQVGMGTNILDASEFPEDGGAETDHLAASIEQADGFAQVYPEHKYRIVESLQGHHHIVGMTGDGVNDAPALKKADAGIAVSGATDAARAAASIVLLTPGLSVIIDAIKESRKIFQHMTSYAIYRIAETIRVLFFMTLSILVFNFYPVTAVMIVLLALLNDGAILSIAVDNVRYSRRPEGWDLEKVLGIATVLGFAGVIASFGLFFVAERVFHLSREFIQPLMYLKLSVAGQLTIFLTRTRGPFWSIRPARTLVLAVLGTQTVATLLAVYGVLMPPIGWGWAAAVWVYALAWFLINDRIKLVAYRVLEQLRARRPGIAAEGASQ